MLVTLNLTSGMVFPTDDFAIRAARIDRGAGHRAGPLQPRHEPRDQRLERGAGVLTRLHDLGVAQRHR